MGILDWVLFGGALILVLGQSLWYARRQTSNEEYFLGGRRMNWLIVGVSLFATTFSPLSFVGLPRAGAYEDYHLYLALLCIPFFAIPITAIWFVPLFHRLQLTTAYEYLERRFSRSMRWTGSLCFSAYTIAWMGSILYATALIVQAALELDNAHLNLVVVFLGVFTTFYTSMGGYRGMIWTNTLQSMLLIAGVLIVVTMALMHVEGGVGTVLRVGWENHKFNMLGTNFDMTRNDNLFSACAFGMFVYLAASAVSQPAVQRIVSMPSVAAARRSMVLRAFLVGGVCLIFFFLGTILFAFYHQHPHHGFPNIQKQDQLTTYFIRTELPYPGLLGILLIGLFSAAMSTISSGLSSLGSLAACDWTGGKLGVQQSKLLVLAFGLLTILVSLIVPYLGDHVFEILIKLGGAFHGPLLGIFLLGMLVPRTNTEGGFIGLAAGVVALSVTLALPKWMAIESYDGVGTGDALAYRVSPFWYGAITCIPTMVVGWLASYAFPPPPREKVQGHLLFGGNSPTERTNS